MQLTYDGNIDILEKKILLNQQLDILYHQTFFKLSDLHLLVQSLLLTEAKKQVLQLMIKDKDQI